MSKIDWEQRQQQRAERETLLIANMKQRLPDMAALLDRVESHWGMEDSVYRYYHGSFKTYHIQEYTTEIVTLFQSLLPGVPLSEAFMLIIADGTGKEFSLDHNQAWSKHTRPMLEAFFHAHFFLKMLIKYAVELNGPVELLPSGWALCLYLYDLR